MNRLRGSSSGSGMLHDVAVVFQRLDPAGCMLFHIRRYVIKPLVVIRLAAGEHEVNRTNQFVGDGDNGFLVTTPDDQAPVFSRNTDSVRMAPYAPSHNKKRIIELPLRVMPLFRLPALSWLPGHSAAQDANRSALPKCERSSPISIRISAAAISAMPGIVCNKLQAKA